jgi:signal transduction histidine kinase/tetratricopeptide (TPR) repeat protein
MKNIVLLISCFFTAVVWGRQNNSRITDSLKQQLLSAKKDSSRCKILNQLAELHFQLDPEMTIEYARQALRLADEIQWEYGAATSNALLGKACIQTGNYDTAIIFLKKAYAYHKKAGNKDKMAFQLGNIGVTQVTQKKYPEAQSTFFEALKIADELHLNGLKARVLNSISYVYDMQLDYDKALQYAQQSLQLLKTLNDSGAVADIYRRIGSVYGSKNDTANADKYLKKALAIFESEGYRIGIADVYQELALLHQQNLPLTLEYRLKAEQIFNADSLLNTMSITNGGEIGYIYFRFLKQDSLRALPGAQKLLPASTRVLQQKSIYYFQKALKECRENGHILLEADLSAKYAELMVYTGNYKEAYALKSFSTAVKDSAFTQENRNQIAEAESKYEIAKKNEELAVKQLTIDQQKSRMWLLAAGVAFLLILGAVFYRQSFVRKRTNSALQQLNNELDEANKIKAKFFAILSHDLRSPIANLINFLTLQKRNPGILTEAQIADREKKIGQSAENLMQTMEAVLLWSKGQMEHFTPDIGAVPVSDLFDYIDRFFDDRRTVQFHFSGADGLVIQTDLHYLQTIMRNLTANAVNALRNTEGGIIQWNAAARAEGIQLTITDNGSGIPQDKIPHIFHDSPVSGGRHGLGLSIVKDLAQAIQCRITVQSNSNGTVFVLQFPSPTSSEKFTA